MPDVQNPTAQPLGPATVNGTLITVDILTRSPTVISQQIRNLVAGNEGYFAEEIFRTPGFTVEGGAIIYTPTDPSDHFLDPDASIGPRAPGSEAPRVASKRRPPQVAYPESWSGSLEVTDEARRRNDVGEVQSDMQRMANTLADTMQRRAIETLAAFVAATSRTVVGTNWTQARPNGVPDADPLTLPQRDFALVHSQFVEDKTGVRPDTLILNQDDAFFLDTIYGDRLPALLSRFGLRMRETPHQPLGVATFVASGQVGEIAFETPLRTEYTREGKRFTDVFTSEAVPVFVARTSGAVLNVTGIRG